MSSLPGLRKLAQALDQSRLIERQLDHQDQAEDLQQLKRLTESLELAPAGQAKAAAK